MRHQFCNLNCINWALSFQKEIESTFNAGIIFSLQTIYSFSRTFACLVDNNKLIALFGFNQEI